MGTNDANGELSWSCLSDNGDLKNDCKMANQFSKLSNKLKLEVKNKTDWKN